LIDKISPNEATGEVETLVGKRLHKMGDRAVSRQRDPELEERLSRLKNKKRPEEDLEKKSKKKKQKQGSSI
jgi:hypothetical protein